MVDEIIGLEFDGGVARVTLARPDRGNAMDMPFFHAFGAVVGDIVRRRSEVRWRATASSRWSRWSLRAARAA